MKKVTIVCLLAEQQSALKTMQQLGVLHVTHAVTPASAELDDLLHRQEALSHAINALSARKPASPTDSAAAQAPAATVTAEQINTVLDTIQQRKNDIAQYNHELQELEPWGSFSTEQLSSLAAQDLYVTLCVASPSQLPFANLPEGTVVKTVAERGKQLCLALISTVSLDDLPLPRFVLPPHTNINQLHTLIKTAEIDNAADDHQLDSWAASSLAALKAEAADLQDDIDFARARDGMGKADQLAYINGYIPTNKLEAFIQSAKENGWAVRYDDIQDDDTEVPTLLNIPKKYAFTKSILDFIGILPGYFETDISIAVYLFLSLFCGMLIGDAGYGLLLTLVSGYFLCKAKSEAARSGLKCLLTMCACTFVFGYLSGNWFGIANDKLPAFMRGLPWLSEDANQNHIKMLCFFIGAIHTSLAHCWVAYNQRKKLRDVIGNLGWAFFIWANFIAATKLIAGGIPCLETLMYVLYGIGFVAILCCGINWSNFGDVIYSPFSFINSFVDILSYIRLFAVGLSGVYIAQSFNDMASALWNITPWLMPVGILVLIVGHLLNIAMAALSILVHGVRLNTLEFSGHIGLSWSGKPYHPLSKSTK